VVRSTAEQVQPVISALLDGGVECIEITFSVPNAPEMIAQTRATFGDRIFLGAGTVRTVPEAEGAIAAGARFLVAPNTDLEVVKLCHDRDVLVAPGAFTPTEVQSAWNAGADVVKLFPASLGGIPYLKALRAPMPDIPLMPTGGVDLENAAAWLEAGAVALGVGSKLVRKDALADNNYDLITETARKFLAAIHPPEA
jgi:2-dehydro-3-deoxyphosphogluconate aldolase/(4S)-4-hydroxy-2-oxoglutarate aldolase